MSSETLAAAWGHDPATDLPCRELLLHRMARALARRDRADQVALILVDVDRFRSIAESLGHEAADDVLATLATRLRATIGPGDTLVHVADDEFAVLCEELTDTGQATSLAARLVASVMPPVCVDEQELFLTASAGIACAGQGGSPTFLLRDASAALHSAQLRGQGSVEIFEPALRARLVERMKLENDLRHAIDHGELRIAYQPIVSLRDRTVEGVEALVRWAHPTWGLIAPPRFLPVAEQAGLMPRIGAWMLREACGQAASWCAAFDSGRAPTMTVNVSAQQLSDPGFVTLVADTLAATGLAPRQLVLDITERAFHDDSDVAEVLHELKALGVRAFLDDFVTGNAALSWLTRFPLDGLKLEAPFVAGLGTDPKVRPLLEAVCGMAAAFDMQVVAEGVETEEQAAILAELGCAFAQGYLFSRPVTAGQLDPMLAAAPPRRAGTIGDGHAAPAAGATVTMRSAADALGVSPSTVRRWADEGRLRAIRTNGGHRRLLAEDVRGLSASARLSPPRVRAVLPPERPLPATAAFLRVHAAAILGAGLNATYEDRSGGWFADAGRRHVEVWMHVLAAALDAAAPADAIVSTADLTERSRLGGASAVERIAFLDRWCATLLRLLSEHGDALGELPDARRFCAVLRHVALEDLA
jgi:diguanylate cyclase (GGDEF)-like protein/excisionase family DNA binding protein